VAEELARYANYLAGMAYAARSEAWSEVLVYWWLLSDYLWLDGHWKTFEEQDALALEAARVLGSSGQATARWVEATILAEIGWLKMERNEFELAEADWIAARELFQRQGDIVGVARIHRYGATRAYRRRDLEEAERQCSLALDVLLPAAAPDFPLRHFRIALEGLVGMSLPDNAPSRITGRPQEAVHIARSLIRQLRASIYREQGKTAEAEEELESAQHGLLGAGTDGQYWLPTVLMARARQYLGQGDLERAKEFYQRAVTSSREVPRADMEAGAHVRLAEVFQLIGDHKAASSECRQAIHLYRKLNKPLDLRRAIELNARATSRS